MTQEGGKTCEGEKLLPRKQESCSQTFANLYRPSCRRRSNRKEILLGLKSLKI